MRTSDRGDRWANHLNDEHAATTPYRISETGRDPENRRLKEDNARRVGAPDETEPRVGTTEGRGTDCPNEVNHPIGEGVALLGSSVWPGAAAADGDLAHGNFARLDLESASVEPAAGSEIRKLEQLVDGNLARLDSQVYSERGRSEPKTDAYLITEMVGNYLQRDLLDEKVEQAPEEIQTAYRHDVIHLLTCAQIYWTDAWHPMHHEDVLIKQLPGGWALDEIEGGTSRLFDFEESVIQATGYEKPDEDGRGGRTREYRIAPEFAIRFQQLADEADANYALHEDDGETGKRVRSSPALKTRFRDESRNRWGEEYDEEHDHLPGTGLLDGALRVLSDTTHKVDISRITEMKDIYKEEWEEAVSRYQQAKTRYENLNYVGEEGSADTDYEVDQIREARSTMQAMQTRKERAEGRYHSLLSGLEVITRQADRIEDGVAYVQNSYEVQPVSGRLTFRRGGPQGLPAVLKAFAYSFEDVYNYDIVSSQTTGLRQLAEDLRRVGCDVDTEALDEYLKKGGKDWVIENYDLPRSLVKRIEHAIKFGGKIPDSMESAYRLKHDDSNNFDMPAIAKHVEEYFDDREEQNRVLNDLKEVFGPQVQMIEELAEGLLTDYWEAHSYAGGRGKGRVMTNHSGVAFCKYDHPEGHTRKSKCMAWYLQGAEAAYVHALIVLSEEFDYTPMAHEHDGLITIGTIPDEAKERAKELSGARRAELTDKKFEDEEDVRELCDEHDFEYPQPPLEDTSCKLQSNPGGVGPQPKPATNAGSGSTTSPTTSSPPTTSESTSTNATPAGGGPNATTSQSGDGRASRAAAPADASHTNGVPPEQQADPPPPEFFDEAPPEWIQDYHREEFGFTWDEEEQEPQTLAEALEDAPSVTGAMPDLD